jgi:predicted aspartyl protease
VNRGGTLDALQGGVRWQRQVLIILGSAALGAGGALRLGAARDTLPETTAAITGDTPPEAFESPEELEARLRASARESGQGLASLALFLSERGDNTGALALLECARVAGSDSPLLNLSLNSLRARTANTSSVAPRTPPVAHCGELEIARSPLNKTFLVPVRIAGRELALTLELTLDTAATMTALDRDTVSAMGVAIDPSRHVEAITATGATRLPVVLVPRLEIGPWRLENIPVAVCEGCGGDDSVGLLGLDVQAALGLELEQRSRKLRATLCASE